MIEVLYLCEKPDQGRKIARFLGVQAKHNGYFDCGDGRVITWARGHLLQPKMPEDYDEDLKAWSWDTLPIIPRRFEFKPRDDYSEKQLRVIGGLIKQAKKLIIATDPDREGELIAYEIIAKFGFRGPIRRMWLNDTTDGTIRRELANPRDGKETFPQYQSALARTCADWVVGMNMSRAATLKLRRGPGKPLSVGRVQTPALALIVRRERAIRDFVPEDYWEVLADVTSAKGHQVRLRFKRPDGELIKNIDEAQRLADSVKGVAGNFVVERKTVKIGPPLLPDLGFLQQECDRRYGWKASRVLELAQALYNAGFLSYPRTDCRVLSSDHVERIPDVMRHLLAQPLFSPFGKILAQPLVRPTHYNDARVTAHTAIVPTTSQCDLSRLGEEERKLYTLVARHYLAAHMPDGADETTAMELVARGLPFRTRAAFPSDAGWRDVFQTEDAQTKARRQADDEDDEDEEEIASTLPPIADGEGGTVTDAMTDQKRTRPPARYSEGTLIGAMKNVAAYVEDEKAKRRLKQTSGLGTEATRAEIIETLLGREFVKREKRRLIPTETGDVLIDALEAVAPDCADPATTAQWEDGLESIVQGKLTTDQFIAAVVNKTKADVTSVRDAPDLKQVGELDKNYVTPERRAEILATGIPVAVPFGGNDEAKNLGAQFDQERSLWVVPAETALAPLITKGWLNADGSLPARKERSGPSVSPERRKEILAKGIAIQIPYEARELAKEMGAQFDMERKLWVLPPETDKAVPVARGWLNADGSLPDRKSGNGGSGGFEKGQNDAAGATQDAPKRRDNRPANWKSGQKLKVEFENRAAAKALGAIYDGDERVWRAPPGADLAPFIAAGYPPA